MKKKSFIAFICHLTKPQQVLIKLQKNPETLISFFSGDIFRSDPGGQSPGARHQREEGQRRHAGGSRTIDFHKKQLKN